MNNGKRYSHPDAFVLEVLVFRWSKDLSYLILSTMSVLMLTSRLSTKSCCYVPFMSKCTQILHFKVLA